MACPARPFDPLLVCRPPAGAPGLAPPPPPPPIRDVQVPGVPAHRLRFCPAAASVAKYICPAVQLVGRAAVRPAFTGVVLPAPLKSTSEFVPVVRSVPSNTRPPLTVVWARHSTAHRPNAIVIVFFIDKVLPCQVPLEKFEPN